ncbi:hypothetical protein [Nocardioides vastitatis]|uniref:NAD(P)-binding domain-containing protein n=1 Tax=Nocardioides vastitatis TaxID=2568655 RepID=A0ABW0ZQK9_9ACTN
MVQHCLDRGYDVVGVCREKSVDKLARFEGLITVVPGMTDDRAVVERAVVDCDAVLTVLVPWGMHHLRVGHRPGCPGSVATRRPARLLLRLAHHPGRQGRLLAPLQGLRRRRDLARPADPNGRYRRPSGGDQPHLRERPTLDRGPGERPGGGREPGSPGLEPPCRRPRARQQPDPPRRLCAVHGARHRRRVACAGGAGHRRPPDAIGPGTRVERGQLGPAQRRNGTPAQGARHPTRSNRETMIPSGPRT